MKIIVTSTVLMPLLLFAALPATAGQPSPAEGSSRIATGGEPATDRNTYMVKTQQEMREWQERLRAFTEKARAKGRSAGTTAEQGLKSAWAKAEAEGRNLQTVSYEGWESAKSSYEKASRDLSDAWDKAHAQSKARPAAQ